MIHESNIPQIQIVTTVNQNKQELIPLFAAVGVAESAVASVTTVT